jgi:hypothetical protein
MKKKKKDLVQDEPASGHSTTHQKSTIHPASRKTISLNGDPQRVTVQGKSSFLKRDK